TSGDASGHLVSESSWSLVPSGSNAGFPAIIAKKSGTAGTLTNIKLGKSASSTSNDFGGDLGELLIFSRQLTSSEEQKVEGYLAHRWGATDSLDANHPYKNVAPIFDNKPLIVKKASVLDFGESQPTFYPLHGSVFTISTLNGIDNLDGQTYTYSSTRVFTGGGSGNLLSMSENTTHNVQLPIIDQDVQNWNKFPTFNGSTNRFATAFSGSLHAPVSGTYNFRWDNDDRGGMYVDVNQDGTFQSSEKLGAWQWGSNGSVTLTAGEIYNFFYMAGEWTGGQSLNWWITQPGGSEERVNFGKSSQIDVWSDATAYQLTTGQPVSIQIDADRNPTSWAGSSALTSKGLSISNSGVITGSVTDLGEFNASVTAINADGNDTKLVYFNVVKGLRTITWDQTIAGLTYGDSPVSLTATATGTGDLNYTSGDSTIIEINGTSAIIRGGGAVTLTATAAENSSAFAAIPVDKEVSIAKADLGLTGDSLSISLGDSIPDLNWTATGWKHNDASLAIGIHPNNLSTLALWLDATDSSTITQTANVVSQWNDKSGGNYHASQSTADRQPTVESNSIDGKTTILFDGSDSLGASTRLGLGANPALTVFVVCNIFTDNNTDDRIFHIGGSSNSLAVGAGSQGWSWRYDGGNELYGSVSHGNDYLLAYTRPSAGNFASAKMFINGTEQT
ncbi:MAG: hypothetical protein VW907_07905, partial [Opitutae bacterium]